MKTVYSDRHRLQDGQSELIDGKLVKCFECPERADIVLARVHEQAIGEVLEPTDHGLDPVRRVHTSPFVDFLSEAWDEWVAAHGAYDALPIGWPTRTLRQDRIPTAIDGKLSYFSMDAGTPITAGTWSAITAAADVALTGVDLVLGGDRHAFSLCRPPGHHAAADVYGGYCFFNNAAIAAQNFRDRGAAKVAVLDVDYHHGNGTQSIFYERADVLTISIHGDPRTEYPFFLGHADERGAGAGEGCNLNLPLPRGTGFERWLEALDAAIAAVRAFRPDALVVPLGLDTFEGDPISGFHLKSADYLRVGARLASLELPTVFSFEGGYAVAEVGVNAVNVLEGFESA